MKRLIRCIPCAALALLLGTAAGPTFAQDVPFAQGRPFAEDALSRISLAVVTPEHYAGLSAGQLAGLRGKIIRMVTAHGLSGDGRNATLVIYPVLVIQERRTMEGLRTLTVVQGELSLYVRNVAQGLIFASFSMPIQGHGASEQQAITSAIRAMKTRSPAVEDFFDTARRRIADYYEAECDHLMQRASALTQAQLFGDAFGLVMSIPSAASGCYARAQAAVAGVFEAYQTQRCGEQVQAARAALKNNAYERGLHLLANVDPSSECHAASVRLMRSVAGEVDARDRRYYAALQEAFRTAARLESERIAAARDIATARLRAARDIARAYYQYRTPRVEYRTLVNTTVIR